MKTTSTSLFPRHPPDALCDRIERELHTLLLAPLDASPLASPDPVDEFADELLIHFALPPTRRRA